MSIKFHVLPRKNPQDITAPEKFYAAAIADGSVDLDTLAEQISLQCTVTDADCIAVLSALERNIIAELAQGRIVKLGRLGSFQISVSSQGKNTPNEVTAKAITQTRVLFRPSQKMRAKVKGMSFKKAG